jgi:hypothetical protein
MRQRTFSYGKTPILVFGARPPGNTPVNMLSFIYRIPKIFLASQTRQTNKPNSLPDGFSGEIEKILFLPPSNEGRLSNSMQANFKVLPITLGIVSFELLL